MGTFSIPRRLLTHISPIIYIHYISKKLTTKDIGHDSQIPRIRARSTLPHSAQREVLPFFCLTKHQTNKTKNSSSLPFFCLKKHILIGKFLLNTMVLKPVENHTKNHR